MYHAVPGRCAVHINDLRLPVPDGIALEVLLRLGFMVIDTDIIEIGRSCVGTCTVRRGARPSEAPYVFDCSSFTQWCYGQLGIEIPRRSIQQRDFGRRLDLVSEIRKGDLIFSTGSGHNYFDDDPGDAVGHVAIATGDGTILHTTRTAPKTVRESAIGPMTRARYYRGACRIIEDRGPLTVIAVPPSRDVQRSDDLRWIILQNL